jgi:hypothetical protein
MENQQYLHDNIGPMYVDSKKQQGFTFKDKDGNDAR